MAWMRLGFVFLFIAVAVGAFGAHALRARLSPEMLAVFETGVRYHFYHALGLLAVGWLAQHGGTNVIHWSGVFLTAGILIFSGSLYALAVTGLRWLGAVTPVGGLCFLAGWALAAVAATSRSQGNPV